MASGGDCTTVYLWDLFRDFDGATPIHAFSGPTVSRFLSIDHTETPNRKISSLWSSTARMTRFTGMCIALV